MTLDQLSAAATELLPCPFCGGDGHWSPTYIDRDTPGTVECANGCGATVIASGSKAERIAAWNQRTGQIVAVSDDAIERVARAMQAMPYMADWDDLEHEDQEHMREMARIAITAMKDTQP